MKRILIGVLFVVAIAAIGLGITLVYGQFGTQEDVMQSATTTPHPINIPSELDPTSHAMIDLMMSGSIPTPNPECTTQIIDLSKGKKHTITLESDASLWYAIDAEPGSLKTMLSPSFVEPINGMTRVLGNYNTYDAVKSYGESEFGIPKGTYTIQVLYPPDEVLVYTIYICTLLE